MRFKIDGEMQEVDLDKLGRHELLAMKLKVDVERDKIKANLDQARAKFKSTGVPADSDWYSRASFALRQRQRESQALQNQLAIIKGRNARDLANAFVDSARRLLAPDVFENIMANAQEAAEDAKAARLAQGV